MVLEMTVNPQDMYLQQKAIWLTATTTTTTTTPTTTTTANLA